MKRLIVKYVLPSRVYRHFKCYESSLERAIISCSHSVFFYSITERLTSYFQYMRTSVVTRLRKHENRPVEQKQERGAESAPRGQSSLPVFRTSAGEGSKASHTAKKNGLTWHRTGPRGLPRSSPKPGWRNRKLARRQAKPIPTPYGWLNEGLQLAGGPKIGQWGPRSRLECTTPG